MKFFFDARFIRTDYHDGISRYSANLLNAIQKIHPVTALIHDEKQLNLIPNIPYVKISSPTSIKEACIAKQLNSLQADIVFSPMQTMGSFGRKYKLILTLHDLIYYTHPQPPKDLNITLQTIWRLYHKVYWPQKFILNRADIVATVSKTTKNLIIKKSLTKKPIVLIPNAADNKFTANKINLLDTNNKNLVYMGSFMPYKNVKQTIKIMELLPEYTLHLLSKISFSQKTELEKIIKNGKVIFHNGVSEKKYLHLLRNASALINFSYNEGFGLPLVEAMKVGTPIVCSDIEVFREICGMSASYVKPDDSKNIVKAIKELEISEIRKNHIFLGHKKADEFSWEKSASALYETAKQLIL